MWSLYPHTKGILLGLKEKDIHVAIASRPPTADIATVFLNKLGLSSLFVTQYDFDIDENVCYFVLLVFGGTMLQRTVPEAEPEAPMLLLDSSLNTKQSRNWKKQFNTVLAGVVAIEVTQGPIIDFVPGRKDSNESPRVQAHFLNGEEGNVGY
ncbi:hypothetical protein V8G54_002842 [Vigna mungo]|uniref:Uncharacterized protein n=1 Tax=Vigna mungo TaxID=3915 RepID=A0AAQ3P9Y5_VIGMU